MAIRIDRQKSGFTLIELLIAMVIIAILTSIAVPMYDQYRVRIRNSNAVSDIMTIQVMIDQFRNNEGDWPDDLVADLGVNWNDPWGNAYRYLKIEGGPPGTEGQQRKDHNLVPVNSDYDLYSMGPDGQSVPPFTGAFSRDDIVRAQNGSYVGIAAEY